MANMMQYNDDNDDAMSELTDATNMTDLLDLEQWDLERIHEQTAEILDELILTESTKKTLMDKLYDYKLVEDPTLLVAGAHIRIIPLNCAKGENCHKISPQSAIFCKLTVYGETTYLVCKNYGYYNRHFQLNYDDYIVFQKFTKEEHYFVQCAKAVYG